MGRPRLRLGELEVYGTARAAHTDLVASYGATPIDDRAEDSRQVLPDAVDDSVRPGRHLRLSGGGEGHSK